MIINIEWGLNARGL